MSLSRLRRTELRSGALVTGARSTRKFCADGFVTDGAFRNQDDRRVRRAITMAAIAASEQSVDMANTTAEDGVAILFPASPARNARPGNG